jgi:hypothetical protein
MNTIEIANCQEGWAGKPERSQIAAPNSHLKSVSGSLREFRLPPGLSDNVLGRKADILPTPAQ